MLSPQLKKLTREVDVVTVKGSAKPMKFFTVSIETDHLKNIDDRFENLSSREKKQIRNIEKQTIL